MSALVRRILLAPLPRLIWTGLMAAGLLWLVHWSMPSVSRLPSFTVGGAIRNALLTLGVFVLSLLLERKLPRDAGLGLTRAVPDTVRGFALGAGLFTAIIGLLALVGSYRIVGWAPLPEGTTRAWVLGEAALWLFFAAVYEEVLMRGIVLRLLEQSVGTWLAIALSALFFGLGHRNNPGATWVSTLSIAIEAGGLLGAAYVATRSLWLVIGLHWAWNLFEGPVWGSRVSGLDTRALADAKFHGSTLLTGGAFGPEAGLVALLLGAALGVVFLVLAERRGQAYTPPWMHRLAWRLRGRPGPAPGAPVLESTEAAPPTTV